MRCQVLLQAPDILKPVLEKREVTAASERIDAILGKLLNLSRSQSVLTFREKKVFVNGRQCENNSYQLKCGDVVTCRGFGKFIYEGVKYETKKGKICAEISVYI
jgi:RNA-binding protein YlmH